MLQSSRPTAIGTISFVLGEEEARISTLPILGHHSQERPAKHWQRAVNSRKGSLASMA